MDATMQVDAFFAGRGHEWAIHEQLKERLTERFPGVSIRVMKTCIAYDDPSPFVYISFPPRKYMRGLVVTISLREKMDHPRFFSVVPVSASRCTAHIRVEEETEIDEELLGLIAMSHR